MTTPTILQEHKHWLAINKPSGWVVEAHGRTGKTIESWTHAYLSQHYQNPYIGIVHRLDKVTSGVLIVAKRKSALRRLNQQFAERMVEKTYLAVVSNRPEKKQGSLVHFLEKDQLNKRAIIHEKQTESSRRVELTYEWMDSESEFHLLEIKPQTGKFHQIRAQLAYVGCPIVGDEKYGSTIDYATDGIMLHAHQLQFHYPNISSGKIAITAELPDVAAWRQFDLTK
jgi:23S rRNA pseudouridine1911/1915/1917 synthase